MTMFGRGPRAVALWLLLSPPALAIEVPDLYIGRAIVTGTAEPERSRGIRAALADVVVKLTGDARLADGEALTPLLAEPERFVDEVTLVDRMKGIPVHDEQGTRERPHNLTARFDPAALDAALDRLGISRWPADRPLVEVRLGIETGAGRFVLAAEGPEGYGQRLALVETAARRGLPIRLPAPTDAAAIPFEAVTQGDVAPPPGGAALSGALRLGPEGRWRIDWTLEWGGRSTHWSRENVSFDAALRAGVEGAARVLSGRDAPE